MGFIRSTVSGLIETQKEGPPLGPIALEFAKRFPELALRLPPRRRPWMSADDRLQIFGAVAMSVALFSYRPSP
jgi:hypothetical protein